MSKYKVGDNVVIRNDLKVGEIYGGVMWDKKKEYMKLRPITINYEDHWSFYWIEGYPWACKISEEMIQGLYQDK